MASLLISSLKYLLFLNWEIEPLKRHWIPHDPSIDKFTVFLFTYGLVIYLREVIVVLKFYQIHIT